MVPASPGTKGLSLSSQCLNVEPTVKQGAGHMIVT